MSKNTYLCVVRSESGSCEPPAPSQMEAMYAKFNAWKETFKDNIVDMGGKLEGSGRVVSQAAVTDGPFVEVKEIIGGYMMIQAADYDEAVRVVQESPGVTPGSSVEVRQISAAP